MERFEISKNEIKDISFKLKEFLNKNANIHFGLIFGSCVKGKQKRGSDLDVAIYFKNLPGGVEVLYLINELSELTGKEIDLIVLNSASPFLRHQVMKYGITLIVKDRFTYRQFREKTISDYDEYKFISGMNVYDR